MRRWTALTSLALAGCAVSVRPTARQRGPADLVTADMFTAQFEVSCDSCRVRYGKVRTPGTAVVEGGWTGTEYLGTIVEGQDVRIELLVEPFGETWVGGAVITVNGRQVATGEGDEPGDGVYLRTRVGPR